MSLFVRELGVENEASLVFLHGLGVSGWMWNDQVEQLSTRYHCLVVDLPGNGESYEREWISFSDTAQQLAELIRNRAHDGRAHVVGLSLGGYSALHLLSAHPGVVDSMIVSGVTARPLARNWLWRPAVRVLSRALRWRWVIALSARMMQLPAEVIPLYRRDSRRLTRATIGRVYAEVLPFTLPERLGKLEHRVLAVAGDSEARAIRESLGDVPALMSGGRACLAREAHHGWNAEHPELFSAMVEAWVEDRALPRQLVSVGPTRAEPSSTEVAA